MYMRARTSDRVFEWWLRFMEDYIDLVRQNSFFLQWMGFSLQRHLEAKRWTDLIMDRMWRQLGFAPLQEIIRVHERLTLLESKLNGLREEDLPRMAQSLPEGLAKTPLRRYV